ncbi:hypothetical protein ACIBO2_32830 [Nonomuraea sp. NPDC050022]|uniref:hypothetical protein n=1 Tax=unclassified Nonomuraea TaxID=2593643 RepID=UPI0033BFF7F8
MDDEPGHQQQRQRDTGSRAHLHDECVDGGLDAAELFVIVRTHAFKAVVELFPKAFPACRRQCWADGGVTWIA